MKYFFAPLFFLFFCFSLFAEEGKIFDKILITIGKESITKNELEILFLQINQEQLATEKGKALVIRDLINELLFLTGAKESKISASVQEINQAIENFIQSNNLSEENFAEILQDWGIDLDYFREQWRRKIIAEKFIQQKVSFNETISEKEIQERFLQKYPTSNYYHLMHILKKETSGENLQQLLKIRKEAIQKNNFPELVKKHSEDTDTQNNQGKLPPFREQDMLSEIAKAVTKLQVGEISLPVQTSLGYHLFLLQHLETKSSGNYAELKNEIQQEIYREKSQMQLEKYIQILQNKYKIEVKDLSLKQLLTQYELL